MTRRSIVIASLTLFATSVLGASSAMGQSAAAAAAKASPELVSSLSKAMGSTSEQAAGAAGAIFGMAKSQLKADEFKQIGQAVPGMDLLLKAAPAAGGGGASDAISKMAGGASGLAGLASAFTKLGLKPELAATAAPIVSSFVTKYGGAPLGNLLASVLK